MNTIIEKIRAEVERQKEEYYPGRNMTENIVQGAFNRLLSSLSYLEKEEKPSEGFDGEFSKFSNDVDAEHPFPICVDEFKDFARHFYEFGRQSKEEDVIIQKARTEKQRVLVTETEGNANVFWDARSLDDVKALLLCGLDFIKKQSKEQPVCEGLEDVADTLAEEHGFVKKPNFKPARYSWSAVRDVFIEGVLAGAKWQKEQIMKSPLVSIGNTASEELQRINYENGKKDMKEQMMKEAVEGEVFMSFAPGCNQRVVFTQDVDLPCETKVKLIIIKEDTK